MCHQQEHFGPWISGIGKNAANGTRCWLPVACAATGAMVAEDFLLGNWAALPSLLDFHYVGDMLAGKAICVSCWTYAENAYDQSRRAIWEKLPSFCGLPAWNDLKDFSG